MKDHNATTNATISSKNKRRCVSLCHTIPLWVAVTLLALASRGEAVAQDNGAGADAYVKSLLHMDGFHFGTAFVDETTKTWTGYGNARTSQDKKRYGNASGYFDGAGDYLQTSDVEDFDPGTDAFTIDFWIYPESLGGESTGQQIYLAGKSNPTSGLGYDIRLAGGRIYVSGLNGWAVNIQTVSCVNLNTWQHIALSATPDTAYLFVGGVLQGSSPRSAIPGTTEPLCIGWRPGFAGVGFKGYMDDFRYSRGIARWSDNFNNPYLTPSIVTQPLSAIILQGQTASFTVVTSGELPMQCQWLKDGIPLRDGGRVSGALCSTLSINGVESSDAASYSAVVSNSRGSVTSSAARLTVDSTVSSLLHMDGIQGSTTFVDETSKTWTAYGDAKLRQDSRRYGTASGYFDGAGDYLQTSDVEDFDPGTDAFTIDFWIFPESLGGESTGQQIYLAGKSNPTSGLGYDIRLAGGKIYVSGLNGWAVNIQTAPIVILNTWQHIALSATPDTAYLFVGGVLRGSSPRSAVPGTTEPLCIGWQPGFAGVGFKGYMDEFRYSRGIARWIGNFTDPYALPRILTQPQGISVLRHDSGQFTLAVSAMWPLQYQWFKDGVAITDSGRVSGASSSVLSISDVGSADQGQYWAVVTHPFGVLTTDSAVLNLIEWSSINNGLLAYYPFDSDANDHSGHPEANLMNAGAAPAVTDNRACFFFRPDSYTYHPNFNLTRVPLSISLWFKAKSQQEEGSKLISNWGFTQPDTYRGFRLKTASPNYIDLAVGDSPYEYLCGYQLGTWYHLVACFDANGVSAYVNGVLQRRKDMPLSFSSNAPKMWIGGRGTYSDDWWGLFDGWIDEVRIYDRVLSAGEVRLLYQQIAGPPVITVHPTSQIATVGTSVTFNVGATGMEPLTYQWRKDGNILTEGSAPSLTIANVDMGDAGSYDVVVTDPAGAVVTSNAATLTVTPATATVILGGLNRIYDGMPKAVNVVTEPPSVEVTVTYDGTPTVPVSAGTYQVLATVSDPSYVGSASGTLVIGKAEATVVVKGYTGVYDGASHGASGSATGVGGEDLSAGLNLTGAFTDVPGGTAQWMFSGGQNYNDQSGNVAIVLSKAEATVAANPKSKTYGEDNPVLDATVTGTVNGDSINYTLSTGAKKCSPVGDYWITVNLGANPNYAVNAVNGVLTVTPASLDVTIHSPESGLLQTVNTPVEFAGSFTPTGNEGQYSAQWTLSSTAIPESTVDGIVAGVNVTASIQFPTPGVYLVRLTITDPAGTVGEADLVENDLLAYVVIYDPNGGFVTGGGWINSPAGAFHPDLEAFAEATGKATFGFVAKYLKGAKVPTGNTEFQFKAGNLNFRSTAYQWLVVAGARAQYKGWGTINNLGEYAFILTAIDGALLGGNSADRFRIKIWDEDSGIVVYDNQAGALDTADLTTDGTLLGGGSIVIHKP